ncbi:MAG TPA: radical SAM protein [Methanothrix sp.]|nr:radical SAM protein [Methanothrix sp.]
MTGKGPALLALSVMSDCNLRCRYCYARGGESSASMSWSTARRAVDIMAESFGGFKIQFTGGEPLLNLALIERTVDYLEELGLRVPCQVQTNATLITPEVAGRLQSLKIGIGVSLDGPPTVNDLLRPFPDGRGSTRSVLNGIIALREAGIRVGTTCVLSRANAGTLAGLVELCCFLGNVEGIAIDFLRQAGRGDRSMQADASTAARGIEAAIERAESLARMGARPVRFREQERMRRALETGRERHHHCYFDACRSIAVMPRSEAFVCPSMLREQLRLGNIHDPDFAKDLVERLIRARGHVQTPQECLTCEDRWLCGGPCLAHSITPLNLAIECAVKRVFMKHARADFETDFATTI